MILALPFTTNNVVPGVVEFDGHDTFVFVADNRRKVTIVSVLNLWRPVSDAISQNLTLGFVLPDLAQSVRHLTEKTYEVSNRQHYPTALQIEERIAYANADLANIPTETSFWAGISYDIVIDSDFLDLSLFSGDQVIYANHVMNTSVGFPLPRKANVSLVYTKNKMLAAGTVSGAESETTGDELARRFKSVKFQGTDIYTRLNWSIEFPSINRPLNLHVLLSGEAVNKGLAQDIQSIVLNLSQQVKAIERQVVDIDYRVVEMRAELNKLSR